MERDHQRFAPEPVRPFRGVGDPRYLLCEIEELKALASAAGLSSLAYQLQCAAVEARWHAEALEWAEESALGGGCGYPVRKSVDGSGLRIGRVASRHAAGYAQPTGGVPMAEAAKDWTKILKGLGDPDGPMPTLAAAATPRANDPAVPPADPANPGEAAQIDVWSETLARVHGAADLLRTREHQLRDLERVHRAAMDRAGERIAALEEQLAVEGQRAERAERAQAEAEGWLRRIHTAVVEQFSR
jgi:hypothetical protein